MLKQYGEALVSPFLVLRSMNYSQLKEIMLRWSPDEIYKDNEGYHACTEWLIGTFAGRSFVDKTKHGALKKMCKYFDETKDTNTLVGKTLVEMGWPNLDVIYQHLFVEGE